MLARFVARAFDGADDDLEWRTIVGQSWREPTFVADPRAQLAALQLGVQAVIDLSAPAQSFSKVRCPERHDHELLKVGRVFRVLAAVEDVHHRHGQDMRTDAAEVGIDGHAARAGRGPQHRQRRAEDRICAQVALVGCSVQVEQRAIYGRLFENGPPAQDRRDALGDVADRAQDALAAVRLGIAVS